MLIEIWERLRGYDKWIETEARIDSAETIKKMLGKRYRIPSTSSISADLMVWKDQAGKTRYGGFMRYDTSPLYQMLEGETIMIRYNPNQPDRYYCRAHWTSWAKHIAKKVVIGSLSIGLVVWRIWVMVKRRGY